VAEKGLALGGSNGGVRKHCIYGLSHLVAIFQIIPFCIKMVCEVVTLYYSMVCTIYNYGIYRHMSEFAPDFLLCPFNCW